MTLAHNVNSAKAVDAMINEARAAGAVIADRLGRVVATVFADNDVSAYSGKPRPGYRDMLAALERGGHGGADLAHRSAAPLPRRAGGPRHGVRAARRAARTVQAGLPTTR